MKVIFVTTESFMDHSFTMINELKKHVQLETIFIAKELTPEIRDFCDKLNVKFEKRKRFINPFRLFFEFRLLMYIRSQKADLVWFNTLSLVQAFLLRLLLRNPLISAHDVQLHPADTDYHGKLSQNLTFGLFKKSIAVMSRNQSDLFEKVNGFKPYILQLPIIDYYEASAQSIISNGNDVRTLKFLFFGSIQPYKGIEILLRAAEILNSKNLDYELNICGQIRYNYEEMKNALSSTRHVKYINEHIDYRAVYELYSNNDVIVVPYKHVTQSGPLLIGYNQNKPCITSNLPGFKEYVVDGKSGLIYNNTAEDLASKMEYMIENKSRIKEMSAYIDTEIRSRFSMQSLAPSYIDVFKRHNC